MEINQLRYFLKVYEVLNYSKAGEELLISRQALRQSIQNLEKELNGELFINEKNHLYPTYLGNELYIRSKQIVEQYTNMEQEMRQLQDNKNELHIGICSSMFPFFTPELEAFIDEFKQRNRNIALSVEILDMDLLFEKLDNDRLDAIITLYMPDGTYYVDTLYSFKLCATVSREHPFASYEAIHLSDLHNQKASMMGNIRKSLFPLYKRLEEEHIEVKWEKIESSIDAFHRMEKEGYILLNSNSNSSNTFSKNMFNCTFADFDETWDLDVISKLPKYELKVLIDFLKDKYDTEYYNGR